MANQEGGKNQELQMMEQLHDTETSFLRVGDGDDYGGDDEEETMVMMMRRRRRRLW